MNDKILFIENQKLRQWWLWLLIISLNVFFAYGLLRQFTNGQQWDGKQVSTRDGIISLTISLTVTLLIYSLRLETVIKEDGIYVKFFPFNFKFKKYEWSSLSQVQVRQYSPIAEYGGWGLRYGFGNGKAYTLSGNKGIQLLFNDGSKLLIGTAHAEEAETALKNAELN